MTMTTISMMTMMTISVTQNSGKIMTNLMMMIIVGQNPGIVAALWVGDSFTTGKVESSIPSDNPDDDDDGDDDDDCDDDDDGDDDDWCGKGMAHVKTH